MWCDLIELPCGAQFKRFTPRAEHFQMLRPLGDTCDTCRRPGLQWVQRPNSTRVGPLCRVRATHSIPPAMSAAPKTKRKPRKNEVPKTGLDLFGEEW